jgi:hypothetical protein
VTGTVVDDLVTLSRTLGEPARQLAILAEGNTSVRLASPSAGQEKAAW